MLYIYNKYYKNSRLNKVIKTNRNHFFITPSTFFRRSYFRSLITYTNILYANIEQPTSINFFYLYNFVIIQYSNDVFDFYFKKVTIR